MERFLTLSAACVACALLTGTASGGLIGLYQFEDASGADTSTISDSSGSGNDGTVFGGGIGLVANSMGGGFGNAGEFNNGTTGRVEAALNAAVGTDVDDFAIAFWFQAANNSGTNMYVTARNLAGFGQLSAIYEFDNDAVELFQAGAGTADPRPGSDIIVNDTNWHHIVYTRTGTDYDLYLDGAKTDIGALSGTLTNVAPNIVIGSASGGAAPFAGQLDDVAWFNEGLSQSQVTTIMGGDFSGFEAVVPEPHSGLTLIVGLAGLAFYWSYRATS